MYTWYPVDKLHTCTPDCSASREQLKCTRACDDAERDVETIDVAARTCDDAERDVETVDVAAEDAENKAKAAGQCTQNTHPSLAVQVDQQAREWT